VTDNVYCLVKIIEKDGRIIAAVQFEIKLFDFFYQSKQLTDYIYTDICCKLSKCIGQTLRSYEHYLGKICKKHDSQPLFIKGMQICSVLWVNTSENCQKWTN